MTPGGASAAGQRDGSGEPGSRQELSARLRVRACWHLRPQYGARLSGAVSVQDRPSPEGTSEHRAGSGGGRGCRTQCTHSHSATGTSRLHRAVIFPEPQLAGKGAVREAGLGALVLSLTSHSMPRFRCVCVCVCARARCICLSPFACPGACHPRAVHVRARLLVSIQQLHGNKMLFRSTRGAFLDMTFEEAVFEGLAPDGGISLLLSPSSFAPAFCLASRVFVWERARARARARALPVPLPLARNGPRELSRPPSLHRPQGQSARRCCVAHQHNSDAACKSDGSREGRRTWGAAAKAAALDLR